MKQRLRVVIIKPSKYGVDGTVERFRLGFMPNSTLPYMKSMTPEYLDGTYIETHDIDEYVYTDLEYQSLLRRGDRVPTLLALVGVQSHQLHRALDLAAYANKHGCMAVIGGPHPMTCDTTMLHGRGISFALAEAELIWTSILHDAISGELRPVYGQEQRWQQELDAPVIAPPSKTDLERYVVPMLGLYPARGCPFLCDFCSVTKISGRRIRTQSVETTMGSLRAAKAAGIRLVMFTSDNFNKYPQAAELLQAMIDEQINLQFFVQCDTQIVRQEELVALLAKARCFQIFMGIESFNRQILTEIKKGQNHPELYQNIIRLCQSYRIGSHFSTIIGFPRDADSDIKGHVETLCDLAPNWASFYILCPIPGTDQYDDYLSRGLISAKNLDRFDTTTLTWKHPYLSQKELQRLLFDCYRKFYSFRRIAPNIRQLGMRKGDRLSSTIAPVKNVLFNRYSAWRKVHPMSGGVGRVKLDSVADFLDLRKDTFDFELAPLPKNLQLPDVDQALNQSVNPRNQASATVA